MPGLKGGDTPSPLQESIAAELFPELNKACPGFPFTANEESNFELPPGDDFGVPDVDENELSKEADDIQAETGFGSVVGACSSFHFATPLR